MGVQHVYNTECCKKLLDTGAKKIIIIIIQFLLTPPSHSQAKAEEFYGEVEFFAVKVFICA